MTDGQSEVLRMIVEDASVPHQITVGELADKIKELLADKGVEAVVVVLPSGRLEVKRANFADGSEVTGRRNTGNRPHPCSGNP